MVFFQYFSFGITPTMEKLYHKGVMKTKIDDCQFVWIAQSDYYRILHQVSWKYTWNMISIPSVNLMKIKKKCNDIAEIDNLKCDIVDDVLRKDNVAKRIEQFN